MKWENKGHEFDRLSERFAPNMKVWIYGGANLGQNCYPE